MRLQVSLCIFLAVISASLAMDFKCPLTPGGNADMKVFCERAEFDDILSVQVSSTYNYYAFKGSYVTLKLSNNSIAWGYPKNISAVWPGSPSNVDTVFTHTSSAKTFFLKGNQYWRFSNANNTLDAGFPKLISEGFNGVPDHVDAAVEWGSFIYFFKGSLYYRYDPCKNESYAVPMSDFPGVPSNIDGVIRTGGYVYFFKGELNYYFYTTSNSVYSININRSWLGCK